MFDDHHTLRASHLLWARLAPALVRPLSGNNRVDGPMLRELCSLPVRRTAPGFFEVVDAAAAVGARDAEVQAGSDPSSGLRVELPRLGKNREY